MYLYEKDKNIVNVYELKEKRDKLFEFKRKEMEKNKKIETVYSVFSNSDEDIRMFRDIREYDINKFIKKYNTLFKHKNGLKLSENHYFLENRNNIDGLLYQLYCGDYDFYGYDVKKLFDKDKNDVKKYFLQTTSEIKCHKPEHFNGESYQFELPNILSIPESIYLLRLLIQQEFGKLVDKNIDEQLSLYDFNAIPIQKLDLDTIRFISNNYLSDKDLELNNYILKKVRHINK